MCLNIWAAAGGTVFVGCGIFGRWVLAGSMKLGRAYIHLSVNKLHTAPGAPATNEATPAICLIQDYHVVVPETIKQTKSSQLGCLCYSNKKSNQDRHQSQPMPSGVQEAGRGQRPHCLHVVLVVPAMQGFWPHSNLA